MASGDAASGMDDGTVNAFSVSDVRVLAVGAGQVQPVVEVLRGAGFHVDECHDGTTGYDGYGVVLMDPMAGLSGRRPTLAVTAADVLRIDVGQRAITVNGRPMVLTAREYALLAHLMAEPRRVFTRDQLLGDLWGSSWRSGGIVTEYIRRLRGHLVPHGLANCLVTRHGFGYSYNPDAPVTLN